MYKLIDSASFFREDEPQVTLINFDNIDELTKEAADDRIHDYAKSIKPHPNKMYIHINAMGAGEFYGANKNGDWFPENNLLEYFKTFETSPAHIFRHHINKDPAKSIGKVLFAIYNPRMHRVELIAEVDKFLGQDIEDRLAQGDFPSTSMACKTPFDICSICGNKAHTRQEYCEHLRNELGRIYPDGRRVMALNIGPLKFFDLSIVIRPADVTSSVLQKIAYVNENAIGSAIMAEEEGLGEVKEASFKKLADLIKQVEGEVSASSSELDQILSKAKDIDKEIINQLHIFNLSDIVQVLADLGISPSLEFLSELISRKVLGEEGRGMGKLVAAYIKTLDPEKAIIPNVHFDDKPTTNNLITKLLFPYVETSSLLPEYVEKRASNIGYASFNANGYEEPIVLPVKQPHEILTPLSKTLLVIGGAAVLAKMYIARLIDEKLKQNLNTKPYSQNSAKILVVKQASDYSIASMLVKAAIVKELKKDDQTDKENLNNLAKATRVVLKSTNTSLGGKLSNIIKTVQVGSKAVDKIQG